MHPATMYRDAHDALGKLLVMGDLVPSQEGAELVRQVDRFRKVYQGMVARRAQSAYVGDVAASFSSGGEPSGLCRVWYAAGTTRATSETVTYVFASESAAVAALRTEGVLTAAHNIDGTSTSGHTYRVESDYVRLETQHVACNTRGDYEGVLEFVTDPAVFAEALEEDYGHDSDANLFGEGAYAWGSPLCEIVRGRCITDTVIAGHKDTTTWGWVEAEVVFVRVTRPSETAKRRAEPVDEEPTAKRTRVDRGGDLVVPGHA
jgi:hypothetical protein